VARLRTKPCDESPGADELLRNRYKLARIEELIDANPRSMTENTLSSYEASLSSIIMSVRHTPPETLQSCINSTEAVLTHLREARDQLNLAYGQLTEKGKTNLFYRYLRTGRSSLEKALKYW
jgi:hypothetical protein